MRNCNLIRRTICSLNFILLLPNCPGAGGFVKQKRTQSTSVRISSPKIGKGEERFIRKEGPPGRAHTALSSSVCRHVPDLVLALSPCVCSRGKQHGQLAACPLETMSPCVGLCWGCLAQLLGPGALALLPA